MVDRSELDEFNVDQFRTELLDNNKIEELKKTYSEEFPSLKETDSSAKWNKHASVNNTLQNPITKQRISEIAKMTFKYKTDKCNILDFGFGYAGIVEHIKHDKSINYKGIDISETFVELQSKKYSNFDNILFKKENVFDMNEKFDLLYTLEVLEHIEPKNLFKILNQLNFLLKDEGIFIVSVPLHEKLENVTNYCSNCGHLENSNGHVRSYSPELILKELELSNFEILEVKYINYGIDFLNKLKYLIKKILGKVVKPHNLVIVARKKS